MSVLSIGVALGVFAGVSLRFLGDDAQAPVELESEPPTEIVVAPKSDRLKGIADLFADKVVRIERFFAPRNSTPDLQVRRQISDLVHFYVYSETPPNVKPAEVARNALDDVPIGTPIEEIRRASNAFSLDFNFMKTVAKVESDFDPKQRTGSYIGLFQLSNYEFSRYGAGDILNPRDNSIAAAFKFAVSAATFELTTHKKPTISDLYLIHQQGTEGAEEHVTHPERIAWKSMCATEEGREKGEQWCKRAIWANTLPAVKQVWKSVDNLTSGVFVKMWEDRIDGLYTRYSEAAAN
ncbi:MAG TPA: transglycosylase [Xanthobacteraceae bacterium]|nr:transglycosylase [Xanthobacteraceae bacterium]